MRFDVALHGLRLYKTRSQALAAIEDRRALLNGRPVKPSHVVHPGDWITMALPGGTSTVEILELPSAALSKSQARQLVREVQPS